MKYKLIYSELIAKVLSRRYDSIKCYL